MIIFLIKSYNIQQFEFMESQVKTVAGQSSALDQADKIFDVKSMMESHKKKLQELPKVCEPNSPNCGNEKCKVHNSIVDQEEQMRQRIIKERKEDEKKMKEEKITAASLQFNRVEGAPLSAAEKAKRLVLKTGFKTYNTAIARRMSFDGVFGLNTSSANTLELELAKQSITERTLDKIDQQLYIYQKELALENQSKFTVNRLKKQIKQLEQRQKITKAMKSNKYNNMKSRVADEIQRKFNLPKVIHTFEVQLREQQKEIFQVAEMAKYDLSEPQSDQRDAEKSAKKQREAEDASKLKMSNLSLDELRAKKRLNHLETEAMGTSYGFLLFDDLQFSSVARGKMYQEGAFGEGDLILKRQMRRRSMRRKVIQDDLSQDISVIEENFNERNARIKAGEMKPRRKLRHNDSSDSADLSSDGMSHFDSDASRVNFWKDINTKDEQYGGAVFVNKQGSMKDKNDEQCDDQQRQATSSKFSKAQQMRKGMKKQAKTQPAVNFNQDYLQQKIAKMETEFEVTKKNIKKVAIDQAVSYFKDKTLELSSLYTNETLKLLAQYQTIRNDSLNKDEIIKKVARLVDTQENIISELRQFIEEHLTPILQLIEREREGIYKHYRQKHKREMGDFQKDDPLAMFGYFGKQVSEKTNDYMVEEMQEYIKQLEFKTTAMASELKVVHDATDLLLKDGLTLEEQIRKMNKEIVELKEINKKQIQKYNFDMAEKDFIIKSQQEAFKTERDQLVGLAKVEAELSTTIQNELNTILTDTRKQLRYVKNVLRTPRLYEFYRGFMIQSKQKDALKKFIMDQLSHKENRDSLLDAQKKDNIQQIKELDYVMTENSEQEKLAGGEAYQALKTAMKLGFDNPENTELLLEQANISETTGLLYPQKGCADPEDIMKQVQDFDIEKEAWKVKKGRSNLYTDKLINTEGDSLPRTGSPVQSDEAFSGNPMNLIKSQRVNTGDEIVNSTEILSPLSAKVNENQSNNKNQFINQTAAPVDLGN